MKIVAIFPSPGTYSPTNRKSDREVILFFVKFDHDLDMTLDGFRHEKGPKRIYCLNIKYLRRSNRLYLKINNFLAGSEIRIRDILMVNSCIYNGKDLK